MAIPSKKTGASSTGVFIHNLGFLEVPLCFANIDNPAFWSFDSAFLDSRERIVELFGDRTHLVAAGFECDFLAVI